MSIQSGQFRNTPYVLQFIFEGQAYSAFNRDTLAANGNAGDTAYYHLQTNGNKITHKLGLGVTTNSENLEIDFIENSDVTAGTTQITLQNLDRRWVTGGSANTTRPADANLFTDSTVNSVGDVIDGSTAYGVGAPAGFKSASDITQGFLEQPLIQDHDYIIRLINKDSVSIDYTLSFTFYESGN